MKQPIPPSLQKDNQQLRSLLGKCRSSQKFTLSKKINQLFKSKLDDKHYAKKLEQLKSQLQTSIDKRQKRLDRLPVPEYPLELPVAERREEIIKTIKENQVTIICGFIETT